MKQIFSSTLGSSDQAMRAVSQGTVPLHLRPYILGILTSTFEARAGRAAAAPERRREHAAKIRAAVIAEAGPITPTHLTARAVVTRRRIASRLELYGLKRAPTVRTIRKILRQLIALGAFGTKTAAELGHSAGTNNEGR